MSSDVDIRPYRAADEAGLIACWNATMWADPIDAPTWRGRYLLDPNFSTGSCPVAVDTATGDLVGFALGYTDRSGVTSSADAWVLAFGVLESRRRLGVGTALMAAFDHAARAAGATSVHYGPYIPSYLIPGVDVHAYPEAIAFLAAIGAEEGWRPLSMKADLTNYRAEAGVERLETGLADAGIDVRRAEPADIVPLLAFLEACFPHWRRDAIGVMADLFGGDPRGVTMHVATCRDAIIGFAQTRDERFGPFGVSNAWRGRGIGAVLLSRALRAMRAQGFHSAWFLWTSDRTAKLYREHGFEEVRRFVMMSKTIGS